MYQVLTLKYRPQKFEDICGQKHISMTLRNAIKEERLSNAYICAGPRGTGKTTTARIFAKVMNCAKRTKDSIIPCLKCESCTNIHTGQDHDVIELDAASNRNVEDIRNLREHALYVPLRGKYKVFIIDEAHMLTKESFNTLLKILEEPPRHVKFILATTELNKIPDTIASRCQIFEFKRLSIDEITGYLKQIVKTEKLKVGDTILGKIAAISSGALRDSISLLDQLITYNPTPSMDDLNELLGLAGQDEIYALIEYIGKGEREKIINQLGKLFSYGADLSILSDEISLLLNNLLTYNISKGKSRDISGDKIKELSELFSVEHLLYCAQIIINLKKQLKENIDTQLLANSYFIKMSMFQNTVNIIEELDNLKKSGYKPQENPQQQRRTATTTYQTSRKPIEPKIPGTSTSEETADPLEKWHSFLAAVQNRTNNLVKTFLQMCKPTGINGNKFNVSVPSNLRKKLYTDLIDKLNTGEYKMAIESVLKDTYNKNLALNITFSSTERLQVEEPQAEAATPPNTSDNIKDVLQKFPGARIQR